MAQPHLKVVGVMGRGDLHHACTELNIHIIIGNHGNLSMHDGQDQSLAYHIFITLVIGVHRHGCIAQQGLRSGGGQLQVAAAVLKGIAQVPEVTGLILVLHLCVRDRGQAVGAPVNDALTPVNQALIVQLAKDLAHGLAASFVQSETLPIPVAGGAKLF